MSSPMSQLPRHIAIIMDGNGRWARKRFLPRVAGHKAGVDAVRATIRLAAERGIEYLTLFAFSTENWQRPKQEVSALMELFMLALQREVQKLHKNNIRLCFIGDLSCFSKKLQAAMHSARDLTATNTGLTVMVAVNYGGQWDIVQAVQKLAAQVKRDELDAEAITAELLEANLSTAGAPLPDLFIRTSGEMRISNFLIWQLAYTELYFTDVYWPDFNEKEFERALTFYAERERRFGQTSKQVQQHA